MAKRCKNLVLDSGPLLSLSPLRDLADHYFTVPQVLDELKDKRAREHFEQLGLLTGVRVAVRNPDPASLTHVIQFAKKTGDYAVLSHADVCVLALTHTLQSEENTLLEEQQFDDPSNCAGDEVVPETVDAHDVSTVSEPMTQSPSPDAQTIGDDDDVLSRATKDLSLEGPCDGPPHDVEAPLYDDPSDEDDGAGEWITPDNVAFHKSRELELLPVSGSDLKLRDDGEKVLVGCMTADFGMQNVLLQMGLTLVGTEGKRIQKLKTWVLRCHGCFKICKDNSKKFCPSCGNPTLLRTSVTLSSPSGEKGTPVMKLHLKKNFQYKLRGTKYSIPAPRPGSAKTGPGEGLILREDQLEYMRARKRADGKRERDEQRMFKGLADGGGSGVAVGSWSDPDWIPGILGGSTRGRTAGGDAMPQIGYGRKNPNERRKR